MYLWLCMSCIYVSGYLLKWSWWSFLWGSPPGPKNSPESRGGKTWAQYRVWLSWNGGKYTQFIAIKVGKLWKQNRDILGVGQSSGAKDVSLEKRFWSWFRVGMTQHLHFQHNQFHKEWHINNQEEIICLASGTVWTFKCVRPFFNVSIVYF